MVLHPFHQTQEPSSGPASAAAHPNEAVKSSAVEQLREWNKAAMSGGAGLVPLRVVVLVAVQLVGVVRGHVGEVLEDVLVGLIS